MLQREAHSINQGVLLPKTWNLNGTNPHTQFPFRKKYRGQRSRLNDTIRKLLHTSGNNQDTLQNEWPSKVIVRWGKRYGVGEGFQFYSKRLKRRRNNWIHNNYEWILKMETILKRYENGPLGYQRISIYFPRYDKSLEVREKNLLTLRKGLLI